MLPRLIALLLASTSISAFAATISPPYAQLQPRQQIEFTTDLPGQVIWQVNNVTSAGVTKKGIYTAPSAPPSIAVATITAVSAADPTQSVTATVTLLSAPLSGTIWYVAPDGNDANPGTLASPFRTLQHAAGVAAPGDTVLARGGVYNQLLTLKKSGTTTAPITFASYPGETATVDGTGLAIPGGQNGLITMDGVSDILFEGFELRNYTSASRLKVPIGIYVVGAGAGVQIIGNHIHDITTTAHTTPKQCDSNALGLAVYGSKAPDSIGNIAISGNEIDHLLTGCSESMSLDGNVDGFAVVSNVVHGNDNIGIDAIGYEHVSPNPDYDRARNGEIRGNLVYNITSYGNPDYGKQYAADGIYVDGGTQIIIEQNVVHDTDLAVEMASEHYTRLTSYITARNNVLYANNSNGVSIGGYGKKRGGSDHVTIVNNTLFDNDTQNTGSGEFQIQWNATNNLFENNIVYAGPQGLMVHNYTASVPDPSVLDYNLYYLSAGDVHATFVWDGKYYSSYAAYLAATGQDSHSAFADPLFADTTTPYLDVQRGSPAIGAGAGLSAPILGMVDIAGNPRVGRNGAVTLGAWQRPEPR